MLILVPNVISQILYRLHHILLFTQDDRHVVSIDACAVLLFNASLEKSDIIGSVDLMVPVLDLLVHLHDHVVRRRLCSLDHQNQAQPEAAALRCLEGKRLRRCTVETVHWPTKREKSTAPKSSDELRMVSTSNQKHDHRPAQPSALDKNGPTYDACAT